MSEAQIHHEVQYFEDALYALTRPRLKLRHFRKDGEVVQEVRQIPSIYREVVDSLGGMEDGPTAGVSGRSIPPLWMDALKWLNEVENKTRKWVVQHRIIVCLSEFGRMTPTQDDLFDALMRAKFRPQDHALVKSYSDAVRGWVESGERLLAGSSRFGLAGECPACGTAKVRRRNEDGYWGDTHALQVSPEGAVCLECGTRWSRNQLPILGKLLGCADPEELAKSA